MNGIVTNMTINGVKLENPPTIYEFPKIWHNLAFIASYFKIFLAIIVIVLVSNEFSFNTIRLNIVNGLSREDFFISKLLMILLLSLGSTIFIFLLSLILGFIYSPSTDINFVFSNIKYVGGYFVQVITFLIFAFFIAFWLKRSGLAIGLLILYRFIIEPVICLALPSNIDNYLPMHALNNLIKMPGISFLQMFGINFHAVVPVSNLIVSITYALIFTYLTYLIIKKRDI